MKALNLYAIGDLRYEDVPIPEPAADEVLLKVLAAGICGSDVPRVFSHGVRDFPTIIGHEFAGEIVSAGTNVDKSCIGKRAAVFPLLPCFTCYACRDENYAACVDYDYYGSRRDGAFAEFIAVKAWNLMLVPSSVPTAWAAMTEPCAVAIHAIGKANIQVGDTVCVFGAGPIGLILAQIAHRAGADKVFLLDIDERKLVFARGLGFSYAINNRDDDYLDSILRLTGGRGADVCIDATGASAAVGGCLNAAGDFATIVLLGNPSGDILIEKLDYWEILRKELTLLGTWNSDFGTRKNDWKTAISYMETGMIDLGGLVTHVFPLEDAEAAFELARDKKEFSLKILFSPEE